MLTSMQSIGEKRNVKKNLPTYGIRTPATAPGKSNLQNRQGISVMTLKISIGFGRFSPAHRWPVFARPMTRGPSRATTTDVCVNWLTRSLAHLFSP